MIRYLVALAMVAVLGCSGKKEEPEALGPECEKVQTCCADMSGGTAAVGKMCDLAKKSRDEATCTARRKEVIELAQIGQFDVVPDSCR